MKKAFMLVAVIAMIATPIFAQDEAPTLAGLHAATGSVSFTFGDTDLGNRDGNFGFSSDVAGSTASSVTASIATDKVEAGATIALIPEVVLNEHDDVNGYDTNAAAATDGIDLDFDIAQDLMDWYDDADGDDYDAFPTLVWETEVGLAAGEIIYTDEDGFTTDNISTEAEWEAAWLAIHETTLDAGVIPTIIAAIDALDSTGAGMSLAGWLAEGDYEEDGFGNIMDGAGTQTVVAATPTQLLDMAAINEASADFDAVMGENGDDTYDVSFPVSAAYLRLLAVAGVVDIEFELNGKAVSVGSKFPQAADDANVGIGLALTSGVVEGLSVSALYTILPAVDDESDDFETRTIETDSGDAPVHGLQFNAGFATPMFNVAAGVGIADTADLDLWYSISGGLTLTDLAGLAVGVEFTGNTVDTGIGLAADVSASILGITPSVDFRMRNGLYEDDSADDETTALSYFNTVEEDIMYLGFGLTVDFAEIMGMNLITLNGGFAMTLSAATAGNDFNVGVGFDLTDLFAPVTVGFNLGRDYDLDLTWDGSLGATFAGITAGLTLAEEGEDNLAFGASLGYTYDILGIAAGFAISSEDAVKSFDITVTASF